MCPGSAPSKAVIAGLDPAIQSFRRKMDHRVAPLRGGPVTTP
jgi:hypothetical protein